MTSLSIKYDTCLAERNDCNERLAKCKKDLETLEDTKFLRAKIITLEDDLSFEKRLREKDNKINEDRINSLTYELTSCAD